MDVRLPDGTIVTNVPEGITQSELMRRVGLMAAPQNQPVKDAGFSLGDLARSFGIGAAGSAKALTDVAGAENVVSSKLGQGVESLQQGMTPERQAEMQRQAARMKAAEESGSILQEIKAGALNVAEAPLQSAAQAIGSFVPYLPALFASPIAAAMRLSAGSQAAVRAAAQQAPKVIGTAQGAGAVKGSIYEGVLRAEIDAGVDPEVAKQKADAAQSYFGGNFDQIALGAGLGLAAGSTGVEKFLTPTGRAGAAPGLARRVAGATIAESLPEAAQGGQERIAENIALQRAGYDVDTFKGVAGAATQEALTGALGAAPIAALVRPEAKPPESVDAFKKEEEEFRKGFGKAESVAAPAEERAAEEPVQFPGGYTATRREISRQEVPESFGIFAQGSDKPLTTVSKQEEVERKIQSLTEIRQEEQARLLQESDKISKSIQDEQRKLEVLEATGQTDTDQYVQAKAMLAQKEEDAAIKLQEINDKITSYSAPLSFAPIGSRVDVQNEFVVNRGEEPIGVFPTLEAAELTLREREPEAFKQAEVAARIRELETKLKPMLAKFNLGDVGLNIVEQLENNAGGAYLDKLIRVSLDEANPIQTMRHESLHALKDLGFFTPQQWNALTERANKDWLVQLKKTPYEEGVSRYDAYLDMFTKEGQAKGLQGPELQQYANEALIEEAIADAFGAYDRGATPPPGMIAALFKKLKNFFTNFGQALRGAGFESADDIFQRVERGELKSRKPKEKTAEKLSLPIMRGEETPKFEGPPKEGKTEPTKIKPTVDAIGKYFDDQVREKNGSKLDYNDKASFDNAVKAASEEVAYQLKREKSGLDWYEDDVKDAFKQTKKIIPELSKTDNRLLFSVVAGIMSPQTTARDNWFIAAKAFQNYVDNGVIPGVNPETGGLWQGGTQSPNKKVQLDFLDNMVRDMGQKKALEWLFTDHTVKEINSFRSKYGNIKTGIDGKLTDMKPGLYAFGPKVGPFVANLNGIHDVTVDKWMTRTFNRYFGTMLGPDGKIVDAPTEPQRRAIKALVNEVAKNAGIKPYQVQSLLWFYEQQLFTKMGAVSPSYGFSDGAKKFAESRRGSGAPSVGGAAEPTQAKLKKTTGEKLDEATRSEQPVERPGAGGKFSLPRDGEGRGQPKPREITPLAGAPSVAGFSGPIPEIVETAKRYAKKNGIPFRRQARYAEVNPDRARRIAEAYERMPHDPQDPVVKEAYEDLIRQTVAQYEALVDAGYKFWFMDMSRPDNQEYASSPWNAMRDLKDNKEMGVFPTNDGFGSGEDFSPEANPLLAETKFKWPVGGLDGKLQPVLANDLFRAVHDAFGHGIEGAGFRAQGEENAWQAHVRLFTGPAVGAITSETRGQNSWLNYGPYGEKNRTAKVEDTTFADQKTGLMPRWAWSDGLVEDEESGIVLGKKQPGASSYEAVHYGNSLVDELDATKYGTGLRGAERRRLDDAFDKRIKNRVYFYIKKDDGSTPTPESGVGQYVYTQKFNNILPPGAEMSRLFREANGDSNDFETNVIDAGYDGYAVPSMGMMVILNHNVPVDYVGPRSRVGTVKLSLKTPVSPAFKQWFGDSKIVDADGKPKVMYHGLAKDTTDFTRKTERGAPIFLTDDPKFAAGFAADSYESVARNPEKYLTAEQIKGGVKRAIAAIRKDYGKDSFGKEMIESLKTGDLKEAMPEAREYIVKELVDLLPTGPHIMPLYVRAERPFDYENPSHIRKVLAELGEGAYDFAEIRSGSWEAIEGADFQEAIQMAGFDSFYVKEHGRKNLAVYEPNQVKSATGNIGTYSRESNDVRYSLKNVAFPSAEEAKKAVAATSVPKTDEFKLFIAGNQWVDEDGGQKVFYHGTASEFYEFTPAGKASAIYLADTPEEAEAFGKIAEDRLRQQIYRALTKDEKVDFFQSIVDAKVENGSMTEKDGADFMRQVKRKAPDFGDFGDLERETRAALIDLSPTRSAVMPLYARAETPFDFRNPEHVAQVVKAVRRPEGKMSEEAKQEAREMGVPTEYPDHWYRGLPGRLKQGFITSIEDEPVQTAIRRLGFDGYVARRNRNSPIVYAVYTPEQVKSATGNVGEYGRKSKNIKYSLPTIPQQITDRINEATFKRQEKGFIERMVSAIAPQSVSSFRQRYLNRYNQMSVYDKKLAEQMGGAALLADQSAESAALMSDLGAGIAASAMGMGDRNGGIPVLRNGITTIDTSVKGLIASLAPLAAYGDPKIYQHYQYWAMVKRGVRLNAEGKLTGIDSADVAFAKALEQKYPNDLFVSVQKDLIAFNNGLVKYMVDTGVLSKERGHEYTKHADYIPFYRQMDDGETTLGPNLFQSLSGVKPPKKLKGKDVAEAPLADFLETMVRNTQSAIQAGIKNYAAQRAIDVASKVKAPGMGVERLPVASTAPNVINVLEKGQIVSYRTPDNLLIEATKSLNLSELPFMGVLSAPADLLRNLVTKDPGFMMANLMRDSMSAWVTSGQKMTPIAGTVINFGKALTRNSPGFEALLNAGIIGGYEFSANIEQSGFKLEKDLAEKAGKKAPILLRPFKSVWDALEKGTTASDAATRALIYERVLADTGNEAEALFRSLEVMNFHRKGNSALIRVLTAAVPFFNARLQGLDLFYRASTGNMNNKDAAAIQRQFWARGMTMMALSTAYWFMVSDEEEYKKQEQETRDNNWIIPSLGVRIPTPFEVGVLFKTIPERIVAYTFGDDTGKDLRDSLFRNAMSTFAFNPIPQTAKPIIEAAFNFNTFTWRPIVSTGMQDVDPKYQVGPSTSIVATQIGQALGLSPLKVDHIIKGYTGTIGMYGVDVIDMVLDQFGDSPKPTKRFEQLPVIKRFALDEEARGYVTQYYELKDAVDTTVRTMNLLEKTGESDEYVEYLTKNQGTLAFKDYIRDTEKTMKELRDMRLAVRTSQMTGDEKRDALLEISRAESAVTSQIQLIKKTISSVQ